MLVRFPNWTSRFEQFLLSTRTRPFKYGSFDCCLFTADAILSITGTDIAAPYRDLYTSRSQALDRAVEINGSRSIEVIVETQASHHHMKEIAPTRAGRGDMILIRRPRDFSLGIVALNGHQILIAGKVGWGPVGLIDKAYRAWKV